MTCLEVRRGLSSRIEFFDVRDISDVIKAVSVTDGLQFIYL